MQLGEKEVRYYIVKMFFRIKVLNKEEGKEEEEEVCLLVYDF